MGPGEFLSIDFFTALFTLGNAVVSFWVLKKFLFKPVMKMIQERQKEIDDMYADADKSKQEASELRTEYEQKLSAANQTSERLVKEAVERGQQRQDEILRQANAQADAIREKAQADIALEKKKAINDAKDEISGIAIAIAEKVVARELNEADQAQLVDSFINELGEQV